MSFPALIALIAAVRFRYVYVLPGVEATRWICLTMSEPFPEFAATDARMQIIAPSKLFESRVWRCCVPGLEANSLSNASEAFVPVVDPATVPRAPSSDAAGMKSGIVDGQPPATNSLRPLNFPVRSRAEPIFA